jgi:hypothetical protein
MSYLSVALVALPRTKNCHCLKTYPDDDGDTLMYLPKGSYLGKCANLTKVVVPRIASSFNIWSFQVIQE